MLHRAGPSGEGSRRAPPTRGDSPYRFASSSLVAGAAMGPAANEIATARFSAPPSPTGPDSWRGGVSLRRSVSSKLGSPVQAPHVRLRLCELLQPLYATRPEPCLDLRDDRVIVREQFKPARVIRGNLFAHGFWQRLEGGVSHRSERRTDSAPPRRFIESRRLEPWGSCRAPAVG